MQMKQKEPLRAVSVRRFSGDFGCCLPNEEDLGSEIGVAGSVVDEIWCCVRDCPVEQPVGRRRHRERFGADFEREDFTSDHPGTGAPAAGKEEDVDATLEMMRQRWVGEGCMLYGSA